MLNYCGHLPCQSFDFEKGVVGVVLYLGNSYSFVPCIEFYSFITCHEIIIMILSHPDFDPESLIQYIHRRYCIST